MVTSSLLADRLELVGSVLSAESNNPIWSSTLHLRSVSLLIFSTIDLNSGDLEPLNLFKTCFLEFACSILLHHVCQ